MHMCISIYVCIHVRAHTKSPFVLHLTFCLFKALASSLCRHSYSHDIFFAPSWTFSLTHLRSNWFSTSFVIRFIAKKIVKATRFSSFNGSISEIKQFGVTAHTGPTVRCRRARASERRFTNIWHHGHCTRWTGAFVPTNDFDWRWAVSSKNTITKCRWSAWMKTPANSVRKGSVWH